MGQVLESIRDLLTRAGVSFRELHHEPTRTSEDSARVRGEPLEIGFNVNYLLDALGALSGESAKLSFTDASSSCLLQETEGQACKYVVMPMRL